MFNTPETQEFLLTTADRYEENARKLLARRDAMLIASKDAQYDSAGAQEVVARIALLTGGADVFMIVADELRDTAKGILEALTARLKAV